SFSGKLFNFVHYGGREDTGVSDYEKLARIAEKEKPKMIVAGAKKAGFYIPQKHKERHKEAGFYIPQKHKERHKEGWILYSTEAQRKGQRRLATGFYIPHKRRGGTKKGTKMSTKKFMDRYLAGQSHEI
ncbi:hypothetical protein QUF72_03400, partial [Desulfobacterales bacterium HSG2]|nr:hypothetical protein [Desulfobacterales bacterium HSG2]